MSGKGWKADIGQLEPRRILTHVIAEPHRLSSSVNMQEGSEETDLRDMASRCRLLADKTLDERSAASLRKLAEEYAMAADAAEQRNGFHWKLPPDAVGKG